jgi:Na+-transporting NADH:ubiquinone oxidoreductase subunit C
MAKKKQILYPVLFMVILTVVYTFLLAFINESSADIIQRQQEIRVQRSVLYTLGLIDSTDAALSDTEIQQLFDASIAVKEDTSGTYGTYYAYLKDGTPVGYVFPFTGNGLWGSISGYIAFSPAVDTILGIDFTSHSETPGLGGRIDEAWFKEQFRGLSVSGDNPIVYRPSEGGNVDAITGATLTSNSVSAIVNQMIKETQTFAEGAAL